MTPLFRRSIAALASTAFMTFALAGGLPLNAAQEAGTTKAQPTKKKSASKAKGASKKKVEAAADDEPVAKPKAKAKSKGGQQPSPGARHRVPAYFSALNLTAEQKEAIYQIQDEYLLQIQELEQKLETLRERRMSETENVLTAPQKKALTEARQAAADRRKAASKAKADD